MQVSELRPDEAVYLDGDRLEEICQKLGYSSGEVAICAAMEDLASLLSAASKLWRSGQLATLECTARQIIGVSNRIGMLGLARIASDVMTLSATADSGPLGETHHATALAATVARLRRVGEQSLLAVWDRQDIMI